MLSVLIPARNEFLLRPTIESVLAAARGEIEVVAVLDGYWPEPNITDDPRVTLIHHTKPIGQRAAVNEAARIAKGKYILKTDAHSMFDEGFDVKLAEDCEYDWTVLPRMYNLHAFDHVCENGHRFYQDKFDLHKENICPECQKKLKVELVWKPRLHRRTDYMNFNNELVVKYWPKYEKRKEAQGDITDVMNGVGACWFQYKDRFWELGGLDESHGSWGQVGVEVALKAWLSGGRHVVNKKTWFAHMFRTTGEFGFPYEIKGKDQEKARTYSRELWQDNKWPLQKRSFSWILRKFHPVPTWDKQPELSVIIPARNETYLQKTIDECLTKLKTDFEVIVGLDGYETKLKKEPRVRICHSEERIGMRPLINKMADMARGKYLMKLDAHCMLDEGIDNKLIKSYTKGDTVVAVRYELDARRWKRRDETDCPYRYLSHSSTDPKGLSLRSLAWPEYAETHKDERLGETMTFTGSIWLMEREQFFAWGGLDEEHGTFGQEGAEISCKTWLSGGRVLVNKDTWYAHWNRGRSSYSLGAKEKPKSYKRSVELWMGDNWPLATKKFRWLVNHFAPVPGWETDLTILHYTDNCLPEEFAKPVREHLVKSAGKYPIISISQKPIELGRNICVGEIGRSFGNILKQILAGAKEAKTKYVAMCEHDNMYPPDHFELRPTEGDVIYNQNRTRFLSNVKLFRVGCGGLSMSLCIANREVLINDIEQKLRLLGTDDNLYRKRFEPGKNKKLLEVSDVKVDLGHSENPILSICNHGMNFGGKNHVKDDLREVEPYWGTYEQVNDRFHIDELGGCLWRFRYGFAVRIVSVNKLYNNFVDYYHPMKTKKDNPRGYYEFVRTFTPFVNSILAGDTYTDEQLKQLPYYGYLVKHLKKLPNYTDFVPKPWGVKHVIQKMRDAEKLCKSIKNEGVKTPIDIFKWGEKYDKETIVRGTRRLVILKALGVKKAIVRIFANEKRYRQRLSHYSERSKGKVETAAVKQFAKYGKLASDKYWKHNYTYLYDRYLNGRIRRILEIGVSRGASLAMWKDAFPKAEVYGIDIDDASKGKFVRNSNLTIFQGDQSDGEFLDKVGAVGRFDLIVDDGSHQPEDILVSFEHLWPRVAKDGWYVFEDIWLNGKSALKKKYRPKLMEKLKNRIDEMCFQNTIRSVSFYPNICFIQKNG